MHIHAVDFKTARHKQRGKELISDVVKMIDGVERQVAGYGIVVWDDAGRSACCYMEGGPVPQGRIASYCNEKLSVLSYKAMNKI